MSRVHRPAITDVRFHAAPGHLQETGLLAWASCTLGGTLHLAQIAVRRTATGRLTLSYPARRDARGRQWPYLRPLDDAARRHLERAILGALVGPGGLEEGLRHE